jgi:ubiquinone/menaquinone biosynthesis C-methylase UbiE
MENPVSLAVLDLSMKRTQLELVARFYPALERLVFGARLDLARNAFLIRIIRAHHLLLVGEGNGRFLESVIGLKNSGSIKVVEKRSEMIRLARRRLGVSRKVALQFIEADIRQSEPGREFDCVVTHFFLDQFNPTSQLAIAEKFARLTSQNGTWINVDFRPARTVGGNVLMWLQYTFFRLMWRIEAKQCFDESPSAAGAGWVIEETIPFLGGLVLARRYQKRAF